MVSKEIVELTNAKGDLMRFEFSSAFEDSIYDQNESPRSVGPSIPTSRKRKSTTVDDQETSGLRKNTESSSEWTKEATPATESCPCEDPNPTDVKMKPSSETKAALHKASEPASHEAFFPEALLGEPLNTLGETSKASLNILDLYRLMKKMMARIDNQDQVLGELLLDKRSRNDSVEQQGKKIIGGKGKGKVGRPRKHSYQPPKPNKKMERLRKNRKGEETDVIDSDCIIVGMTPPSSAGKNTTLRSRVSKGLNLNEHTDIIQWMEEGQK